MKKFIVLFWTVSLLIGCSNTKQPTPGVDITEASETLRYDIPKGAVPNNELEKSVRIRLANRFPEWKETIGAAVDISIQNISKSHLGARGLAHLFVYSIDKMVPIYWANIDIAYGKSADPGMMNVISLPVNASKDFSVALMETNWDSIQSNAWPDKPFYTLVPTGEYLMRFEFELYDEEDKPLGTILSNFIRFSTVLSSPETSIPQGEQK